MALLRFKGIIVSTVVVLFFTTLPIAALISVAALILTGTHLSSAEIFTLLLGLVTLRTTFCYNLSIAMHKVADAKVAIDRMQTFLNGEVSKFEEPENHKPLTRQLNLDACLAFPFDIYNSKKKEVVRLTKYVIRHQFMASNITDTWSNDTRNNFCKFPSHPFKEQLFISDTRKPYLLISNASCSWNQDYGAKTLNSINLTVGCNDNMLAITGAVGSGKSSLLTAILGELSLCAGHISFYGKVAYVPQIPWVFSGTIRENILFGLPFNQEKFLNVVQVCGLTKDLAVFSNGDMTKIGQRGVTLSGGQKARVGLARAVYSDADIYLLDDPLSAVDIKVGRRLFDACIVGHLSGRIRLLVTHQLQYLKDVHNIAVMENGSIVHQGSYIELKEKGALSRILELSETVEDKSMLKDGLDECTAEVVVEKVINTPSIPSSPVLERIEGKLNAAFEDDLQLPELPQGENGHDINMNDELNVQTTNSPVLPTTSLSKYDDELGTVFDLKEEEETKTAGTVNWRLYWNFFREGLPVPMIIILAILLILAQGELPRICWLCETLKNYSLR